jgi:hypothetical protein
VGSNPIGSTNFNLPQKTANCCKITRENSFSAWRRIRIRAWNGSPPCFNTEHPHVPIALQGKDRSGCALVTIYSSLQCPKDHLKVTLNNPLL